MKRFQNKTILIVGASGGLGCAIARQFAAEGAVLALAARSELDPEKLGLPGQAVTYRVDITNPESLLELREAVLAAHGRVDVVVNATGCDVRKPLDAHSLDDFRRSLDVNLLGAMLLTQVFLPAVDDGVILHLGGFADGRLAFPFYSADAAARAGVRSFAESVNRELALARRKVVVSFFSPSPADTPAEQPFHALWRQLGTRIVSPADVAVELATAVVRREKVHIMGGWLTRFFAALNAVSPALADSLMMNSYAEKMAGYFGASSSAAPQPAGAKSNWRNLGIFLVVFSFLAYGFLFVVPFLPLSTPGKLALTPVLIGSGEASFWVGGALLGKEIVARYKRYLNPCNWISRP
jgi:NAD(P)-dependent dehydrogenase (short-subunit alcohol dehydrogenase family)